VRRASPIPCAASSRRSSGTAASPFSAVPQVPRPPPTTALNAMVGKRVALQYEQHKWVPSSCVGDTQYFVTGARVID
jgi:hypothetical protein